MESALDVIVKEYVRSELGGGSGQPDEAYIREIHKCLEAKGVTRDLRAFLRQKLVLILQEKWPNLAKSERSNICPQVITLLQDFLNCRNLLFSLSVFAGELGLETQEPFGKLRCSDAECLLDQLGILKDSELNGNILKKYSEVQGLSLLEIIFQSSSWALVADINERNSQIVPQRNQTINSRFAAIDSFYDAQKRKDASSRRVGVEERIASITRAMESDKEIQIQMTIRKFRDEEQTKIREELKHGMEFELLSREKELLSNFKERADSLKESLEAEKRSWEAEKERQQKELAAEKRRLQITIDSLPKLKGGGGGETGKNQTNDDNIIHEARLQSTIRQLQKENQELRRNKETGSPPQTVVVERNVVKEMETDRVAFLQYNLESQGEELKRLKEQLSLHQTQQRTTKSQPSVQFPSDLVQFLSDSRKRCEKIDEESQKVEKKLREIKSRRVSRPPSPSLMVLQNLRASSANLQKLISINSFQQYPQSIPSKTNFQEILRAHVPQKRRSAEEKTLDKTPPSSISEIKSNKSKLKLAQALEKGALSFEKLPSSSENSLVEQLSSRASGNGKRISFSEESIKRSKSQIGESEIPVKLTNETSEKSQDENPQSEDESSDFWKL